MNRMVFLCLALYGCVAAQSADFSSEGYANSAAEYLRLPLHASAAALGSAVVASREDLANAQYNPAILDALPAEETADLFGSFSNLTLDRKLRGASLAFKTGAYVVYGISYANFGVGGIEERDDIGLRTGTFSYSANAFTASAAGRVTDAIAFGASIRYIREKLYSASANGLGLDLGVTCQPLPFLSLGASVQNMGSYLWWSTGTRDEVVPTGRVGVCGLFLDKTLLVETDFIKAPKRPEEIGAGIQYYFLRHLYVRGGISSDIKLEDQTSKYPDYALGIGMRHASFGFDYACLIPDSKLGLDHRISLFASIRNF